MSLRGAFDRPPMLGRARKISASLAIKDAPPHDAVLEKRHQQDQGEEDKCHRRSVTVAIAVLQLVKDIDAGRVDLVADSAGAQIQICVKAWKVPMIATSDRKKTVGESRGRVMWRKMRQPLAPSMRAASYSSPGMLPKPARNITAS